ncbi:MAG: metallophosphoesterase [Pseudomonadota bacterium]
MPRILQLTDSHVTARGTLWKDQFDTGARLRAQVAAANALAPDLIVHSGDIVELGATERGPAEYAQAADILSALNAPLLVLPGNHDGRAGMRAAFPEQNWQGAPYLNAVREMQGLRIVGLDSVQEGRTEGAFPHAQADWLRRVLDHRPTLLFMHHPPCPMGLPMMDSFVFDGTDRLAQVLAERQVLYLACGHVHCDVTTLWNGICVGAAEAGSVHLSPGLPGLEELMKRDHIEVEIEPLRLRLFDWHNDTLTVKTIAATPSAETVRLTG